MEIIKYRLNPGTHFLKGFFKIRVHVASDSLNPVHPFHADMFDEVVDNLLLFAVLDPKDMAGLKINDVRCITITIMQFELVDPEVFCLLFRLYKLFATISGIKLLKTPFVYGFNCIFAQAGNLGNLFVRICPVRKKITGILVKGICYAMLFGFK